MLHSGVTVLHFGVKKIHSGVTVLTGNHSAALWYYSAPVR